MNRTIKRNKNVESLMLKPRREVTRRISDQRDWNREHALQIDENGQQIEVLEGSGTSVACHVTITVHKKDCARLRRFRSKTRFPPSSKRTAGVYDLTFSKEFLAKRLKRENDAAEEYLLRKSSGLSRANVPRANCTRKTGKPSRTDDGQGADVDSIRLSRVPADDNGGRRRRV